MNRKTIKRIQEFTFILPAVVMFAVFVAYPFIQGFPISFTKWDGMSPNRTFVGIDNYLRIFQDGNVINATKNTLMFTAFTMVCSNVFGLLLALMISKTSKLNNVLRTCIFMPYCLSLVLCAYIWRYIYSDVFYEILGIPSPLGSTVWVMLGLAVISVWRDAGYCMVVYIAAIQGISSDYYEAADLEGANPWQKFKHITFPMIAPAVTTNLTLLLAWGMKVYDYPMAATSGGPGRASETVAMLIYNNLFTYFRAGYGQAIAITFTIAIFVVSTIVSKILRAREVEL